MKTQYLCLDLEMSGGLPGVHDIIQMGAVLVDENFEEISTFETLVYPFNEEDFDPESKRIHGISRFELEDAPNLEEAIDDMEYWLEEEGGYTSRKAMQSLKICGQGINNDISFMKASYNSIKLSWPFAYQFLDLQDMTLLYSHIMKKNDAPHPDRLNLNSIADYFGMERDKSKHDALEDARITAACLAELWKKAGKLKIAEETEEA